MKLPVVGVSSCLIGEKVRYDGSSRTHEMISCHLSGRVSFLPVCPESMCGMPVPREPMDLYCTRRGVRLITVRTGKDLTGQLSGWSRDWLDRIQGKAPSAFILKARSPSCGIASARIHREGQLHHDGNGLFASMLIADHPDMPILEETELDSPEAVESFLQRIG